MFFAGYTISIWEIVGNPMNQYESWDDTSGFEHSFEVDGMHVGFQQLNNSTWSRSSSSELQLLGLSPAHTIQISTKNRAVVTNTKLFEAV
jgi:hypothetical protein